MKRSRTVSLKKTLLCCLLNQEFVFVRISPSPGWEEPFLEAFLLIRLFSLPEERPIYSTPFAANCLKAGLSGDELSGLSLSNYGSFDAWIVIFGPIDWRWPYSCYDIRIVTVGPGAFQARLFDILHLAVRLFSSGSVVAMFLNSGPLSRMLFLLTMYLGCLITNFLMLGLLSLDSLIGAGLSDARFRPFGPGLSTSGSLVFGNTLPAFLAVRLSLLVFSIVSCLV